MHSVARRCGPSWIATFAGFMARPLCSSVWVTGAMCRECRIRTAPAVDQRWKSLKSTPQRSRMLRIPHLDIHLVLTTTRTFVPNPPLVPKITRFRASANSRDGRSRLGADRTRRVASLARLPGGGADTACDSRRGTGARRAVRCSPRARPAAVSLGRT